jgi:hypothetical protein
MCNFKSAKPCEFTCVCDSFFQGSYTCTYDKPNCPIWKKFENKEIIEFRIENIKGNWKE